MIARTRISALLAGYRDVPPAAVDGVVRVLEAVSMMVADLPDIVELDCRDGDQWTIEPIRQRLAELSR